MKTKIITVIAALGLILIAIFTHGLGLASKPINSTSEGKPSPTPDLQSNQVAITSLDPSNLDGLTVVPAQIITFQFNKPLLNNTEFRYHFDPDVKTKIQLSTDKKTVKIIPSNGFTLGQGYTLSISGDSSFELRDSQDNFIKTIHLGTDYTYHFRTINYSGI